MLGRSLHRLGRAARRCVCSGGLAVAFEPTQAELVLSAPSRRSHLTDNIPNADLFELVRRLGALITVSAAVARNHV